MGDLVRYPGFIGPSYRLANKIAAADETYNLIPSKVESGTGPAPWVADLAPGYQTRYTLPETPTRGSFSLNGATFAVGGENLYEIPITGSPILRASGLSNVNNALVSMAGNGDSGFQLMIVSDSTLYCFELLTNTLTAIPDIQAAFVVFQDGYFIALDPNTSSIYLSALENGLSWDPLDVAQRNDSPDKWISMIVRPKEVWLFGGQSTSVYYNAGDAGFPFIPNPSVAIAYGTPAPTSVGLLYGSPAWLANDLTFRYANGYTAQRISNHAVEYSLSQMQTVSDCDCFTYEERGHPLAVWSFPTEGVSWSFDLLTNMWHKRGPFDGQDYGVVPVWWHTFAYGMHLVGDRTTGAIYEQSQDFSTDTDGVTGLRWLRRAPHINQAQVRINYDRFQLLMETGVGLATGQGSAPVAMLRWSDDGGQTWSNVLEASVGATGAYSTLVFWTQLGQARDRIFEVSGTDPVPWRLVDAFLKMRMGTS